MDRKNPSLWIKVITQQALDPVEQLVASLIAEPGIVSMIPARSLSFVETDDHEVFSTVILLLLLIQEGLVSATKENICTKYWLLLSQACPGKSEVRLTGLNMTIAVVWGVKPQTKQ